MYDKLYTLKGLLGMELSVSNKKKEIVVTQTDVQEIMSRGIPYGKGNNELICMDKPRCMVLDEQIPVEIFEEGIWTKGMGAMADDNTWHFITPRDIATCLLIIAVEHPNILIRLDEKHRIICIGKVECSMVNVNSLSGEECEVILLMAHALVSNVKN